jgi:hypothetical protein
METLPWELIGQIGDFLRPKWRCRLYICCRSWWQLLRQNAPLFDWCKRVDALNKEVVNNIDYRIIGLYTNNPTTCLLIYGKKRTFYDYDDRKLYITNSKGIMYNIMNDDIVIMDNEYDEYLSDIYHYADNFCRDDKSISKIIHNNGPNIFKYLHSHEILKTVIALGVYYYYIYNNYRVFDVYRDAYDSLHERLNTVSRIINRTGVEIIPY